MPLEEIAFIHDADTETRKAELFAKVRSGQVRFLIGSTAKMGAGTNVQDLLIAEHHLDVPWRPSDIEQREGRIIRQGNQNKSVQIFRYITEGTFDSYSWQLIENKQKFIGQIMTSKSPVRSCEDIDETALTYAEIKALATGNPYIKEKMDLDIQVSRLKLLKAEHTSQIYRLENDIAKNYPQQIAAMKERIAGYQEDIQTYQQTKPLDKDDFSMKIGNKVYANKKEAGTGLTAMCREVKKSGTAVSIGAYQGFKMSIMFDSFFSKFTVILKGQLSHEVEIGTDVLGNIQRLNNALEGMNSKLPEAEQKLDNVAHQLETAKAEIMKPFEKEQELAEKQERLSSLNGLLSMDEKNNECLIEEEEQEMEGSRLSRPPGKSEGRNCNAGVPESGTRKEKKTMEKKSSNEKRENGLIPKQAAGAGRLFVDMDGTLAEYQPAENMEILFEKGYFLNLEPQQNVVDAVKKFIRDYPEIQVYIMSSVLSDSRYALQEKNEWLNRYLPEIDGEHRIFPPCGANKLDYVPGGSRFSDHLLDDYTNNLTQWDPPAKGIKLLNGINHSRESWKGSMLRCDKDPEELAENIMEVIEGRALIRDERPFQQKIRLANQDYDKKMKAGYVSEELRSQLAYLTKEQALKALQEGIHICCVNDYKEYHGSHADEYSFTELNKEQGVRILYGTRGSGAIHKACISPYYLQPEKLKELLQRQEQEMHQVKQEPEKETKRVTQHIPDSSFSL